MVGNNKKKPIFGLSLITLMSLCGIVACQTQHTSEKPSTPVSSEVEESSELSSIAPEESYNIVRPEHTPDYDAYEIKEKPAAVNLTYYSDIYSRGFSWLTDDTASETKLYLVQSDKGEKADFSSATAIEGTSLKIEYNAD